MFKNLGLALVFKIHEDPHAGSLTYTYTSSTVCIMYGYMVSPTYSNVPHKYYDRA